MIERSRVEPDRTGEMMKIGAVSNRSAFGSVGGLISASVCLALAVAFAEAALAGADDGAVEIPWFPTRLTWNPVNLTSALLILRCQLMATQTTHTSWQFPGNLVTLPVSTCVRVRSSGMFLVFRTSYPHPLYAGAGPPGKPLRGSLTFT
ncbi:hypothetical protein ACFSTC_61705 [Nonomuraea ferruginea]